jgi:ribosomal protein L34E
MVTHVCFIKKNPKTHKCDVLGSSMKQVAHSRLLRVKGAHKDEGQAGNPLGASISGELLPLYS